MAYDIVRLGYEIDSSSARTAAGDLDKMLASVYRTVKGVDSLSKASKNLLRDESGRFISATQSVNKYAEEIDRLRSKYNPLYEASKQFEHQQNEIKRALELGAISKQQASIALDQLQAKYITSGNSATVFGGKVAAANRHILNMGFQFQDIGMMMASGQSPLILAMQQGTQVAGIFNQMKMEGQGAFSALRGGLLGLINPTSLLTIGIIAGAAALGQWGIAALRASDNTKTLEDAIGDLEKSTSELQRYTDLLNKSYAELRGEFGENAHQARELFKVMSMLSQLEAMDRMVEVTEAVSDNFEDMAQRIERINFAKLENAERVVARQQRLLNEEMGVTEDQARSLLSAQNAVNDAITSTEKLSAMRGLFDAIVAVRDETGKVPDALRPLAIEIGRAIERMQILETKSSDAEDATRSIFEVAVSGDWLDPAIKQAGVLANMLYTAVLWKNALFNRNQTDAAGNETQFGEGSRARSAPPSAPNNIDAGLPPVASGGGGSGGGNRRERELERFIESLQTERETLEAWRVEQMDLLAQFNEAELEAIGGHNEAKLRLEQEYQDKLDAIKNQERSVRLGEMSSMFAGLAAVAEQGGKKMLKVQATLSAAATMIAAYETASKAAAEATTIPGRIAAWAFFVAQGLSAVKSIQSIGSSGSVSGSTGSGAPSGASAAAAPEPERVVRINVQGERWMRDLVEGLASQLYEASEDGARVVIAR